MPTASGPTAPPTIRAMVMSRRSRRSGGLRRSRRRSVTSPGFAGAACSDLVGIQWRGRMAAIRLAGSALLLRRRVRLLYWVTASNGQRLSVDEFVPLRYTATKFGGRQQWRACLRCGRRCRRLFGGRHFRCRQCHGLKYASRNESPAQRAVRRADRIANPCTTYGRAPPRPSGSSHRSHPACAGRLIGGLGSST
jgi:hypothetical protein